MASTKPAAKAPAKPARTPSTVAAKRTPPAAPTPAVATPLPRMPPAPPAAPAPAWQAAPPAAPVAPRPVAGLGKALVILVALAVAFGVLNTALMLATDLSLGGMAGLGFLGMLATVPTIVVFCVWLYRVLANARDRYPAAGIRAGWAVGSFFIPVVQLFVPYLEVRRAWTADTRRGEGLLATWFFAWALGQVVGIVAAIVGFTALFGVLLDSGAEPGTPAYEEAQAEAQDAQLDAQRPFTPVTTLLQLVAGVALILVARHWSTWQDPPAS